jgi:hypothetical protein
MLGLAPTFILLCAPCMTNNLTLVVNDAGTWNESYLSYHGISDRRIETQYDTRLKKICCEKSAEIIVLNGMHGSVEGRNGN